MKLTIPKISRAFQTKAFQIANIKPQQWFKSCMSISAKFFLKPIICVNCMNIFIFPYPVTNNPIWGKVLIAFIAFFPELFTFVPLYFVIGTQTFINKNSCAFSKLKYARVSAFQFLLYLQNLFTELVFKFWQSFFLSL